MQANKNNGKSYIGQTTLTLESRKKQNIRSAYHKLRERNYFHWALREYNVEDFKWEVICTCQSKQELNIKEKYYINKHNTSNPDCGYNKSYGGQGIPERNKQRKLFNTWPYGVIFTQRYLTTLGYYHDLVRRYKNSHWIEPIGRGAYKKYGDSVGWQSGVHAFQKQLKLAIHPGGRGALELLGYAHNGQFQRHFFLFGQTGEKMPKWFWDADWDTEVTYHQSQLFGHLKTGLTDYAYKDMTLSISAPERAAMEMLYLVPKYQGFDEADKIMNGLLALRPDVVQSLLENCQSIKVKRLFLYLAERNGVPWFENINHKKVDLGSGKRVIVKDGKYNAKYQICVPEIRDI